MNKLIVFVVFLLSFNLSFAGGRGDLDSIEFQIQEIEEKLEDVGQAMGLLVSKVGAARNSYFRQKTDESYKNFSSSQVELGIAREEHKRYSRKLMRLVDRIAAIRDPEEKPAELDLATK